MQCIFFATNISHTVCHLNIKENDCTSKGLQYLHSKYSLSIMNGFILIALFNDVQNKYTFFQVFHSSLVKRSLQINIEKEISNFCSVPFTMYMMK